MDIKRPSSELCTNNPTKVLNEPENNGCSEFNNKTVAIVVATRQYPYGNSSLTRGFGDIVSGVKALEYLRNLFPEAKYSFVFEHYADKTGELERLMSITTIEGVKTFILDGRRKTNAQSSDQHPLAGVHQEAEVSQLLEEANVVFHGPSGLIAPLAASNGQYANKTVSVTEYDENTGDYNPNDCHGIPLFYMGFRHNRLYLIEKPYLDTEFKNELLRCYCANPVSKNRGESGKNVFYFAYGHTFGFIAQMVRVLVLMEGNNNRDVVLVSSKDLDLDEDSKDFAKLLPPCCPYKSVKVFQINSNGEKIELEIFNNPHGRYEKSIRIISPGRLENSDVHLLQQGSEINYSSGDISTTDVLSKGKIPIVDPNKKLILARMMLEKVNEFCTIPGNEQFSSLITPWLLASSSFTAEAKRVFSQTTPDEIASLQQLLSPQWQAFERQFTEWLKQNNQTKSFIREKTEAIIRKTAVAE